MIKLNAKEVKVYKFPNNEIYIRKEELDITYHGVNSITLKFESDSDFMVLMYIKKHLDDINVNTEVYLYMPYLPYSRMDRTEGINLFTLKYITSLINSLKFNNVIIDEPHSDVGVALLDRVSVIDRTKLLTELLMTKLNFGKVNECTDFILYPDAGALKRYSKQIKWGNIITCNKNRDFTTGQILNVDINWNNTIPSDKLLRVIIVDDLCSRGGTFLQTAKEVKKSFPNSEIYLVVSHCENTIFTGELLDTDYIKEIYTTDSILNKTHEKIHVMEVR